MDGKKAETRLKEIADGLAFAYNPGDENIDIDGRCDVQMVLEGLEDAAGVLREVESPEASGTVRVLETVSRILAGVRGDMRDLLMEVQEVSYSLTRLRGFKKE